MVKIAFNNICQSQHTRQILFLQQPISMAMTVETPLEVQLMSLIIDIIKFTIGLYSACHSQLPFDYKQFAIVYWRIGLYMLCMCLCVYDLYNAEKLTLTTG